MKGVPDGEIYDWTPEAVAELRRLWDERISANLIAQRMGTSKNSILGKAHRLAFPSRESPIKHVSSRPVKPRVIRLPPSPTPLPIEMESSPVVLSARETCQWIDGKPQGRTTLFCGAPTVRGSSYCPKHHARCWITPVAVNKLSEIEPSLDVRKEATHGRIASQ